MIGCEAVPVEGAVSAKMQMCDALFLMNVENKQFCVTLRTKGEGRREI